MAYTTTTLSNAATLVGTSANDTGASANTADIQVSSKEGIDTLTLTGGVSSGTVGMGGGTDTVAITTAVTDKLSVTLGDGADAFSSTVVDTKLTVSGQGGADTFTLDALATSSRYGGGQGKDVFKGTGDGGNLGADSTITGGSEVDTIGLSTSGMVLGARAFINGNVGADLIYVNNAAGTGTIRGGSENDTITVQAGGADATSFYGDKGNDTITDLGGDSSLFGGDGNDTLTGGNGADSLIGGAGADLFSVADTHNGGNTLELTRVIDFSVADTDKLGAFGITDVEQGNPGDLISAGDATSIAASEAISLTILTGETNMTDTSGNVLVASSTTAFTTTTVDTALETGGSLAVTFNNALAANDGFLLIYDNNVDTFIASVTTGAVIADNAEAAAADFTVTNLVQLDGIADATTITASQLTAFAA